jgi:hypothetical protein
MNVDCLDWRNAMSAGTKAGLLFLLPQLIIMICATVLGFLPIVLLAGNPAGIIGCCFAPIAALLMAMPSGYFAAKWHPDRDEITGQGVTAGVISGVGALLGCILFWVIAGALVTSMVDDAMLRQILTQMKDVQPDVALDMDGLRSGLSFAMWGTAVIGVISGSMSLGFSLVGGLLGMYIARGSMPANATNNSIVQ